MRVTVGGALLAVWLATGACFAYRPVALAPKPGTEVRIVLASALVVTTVAPVPDTTHRTYPGVLEASGTIQAAAGDTVALRLGELRTAAGSVPNVSAQIALLPTGRIARIEELRFQAGRTILFGLSVSVLALTAYIVLLTAAIAKGF